MIDLLIVVNACFAVLAFAFWRRSLNRGAALATAREQADNARMTAIEVADRLSVASSLNSSEIMEIMAEQNTTILVDSDIWQTELPYGRWAKFDDGKGRPNPEIRGFWLNCPGKLIGVKMPVGSEYDMHSHPWAEILIGMSGLVWAEIEGENGTITKHRLGPEDVVKIPSQIRHAVIRADTEAQFVCIWGVPKK